METRTPDALLFREVGDPGVFLPPADSTALVGQVRCGTELGAAQDPRLIRYERASYSSAWPSGSKAYAQSRPAAPRTKNARNDV
jgi:hypothetical protein